MRASGPGRSGFGVGGWGFGEPGGDLLFRRLSGSTIGAEGFHGRVRDGIGCFAPRCGHQAGQTSPRPRCAFGGRSWSKGAPVPGSSPGMIREVGFANAPGQASCWTCLLGALALAAARGRLSGVSGKAWAFPGREDFGSGGFERLVPVGSTDCSASTPGLSTWWSSTALDETWF